MAGGGGGGRAHAGKGRRDPFLSLYLLLPCLLYRKEEASLYIYMYMYIYIYMSLIQQAYQSAQAAEEAHAYAERLQLEVCTHTLPSSPPYVFPSTSKHQVTFPLQHTQPKNTPIAPSPPSPIPLNYLTTYHTQLNTL